MDVEVLPGYLEKEVERAKPLIGERLQAFPACHGLFADLGRIRLPGAAVCRHSSKCEGFCP